METTQTTLLADRFEIGPLIGGGGMGDVFEGVDHREARRVAIKRLRPYVARDAQILQRFSREGAVLRAASHPNIVGVLAVVDDPAGPCIVMEHVPGGTLEDLLHREPRLPIERVLALALDLSDALARAHRLGIVHRDLKPSNVLLAEDGTPRLSDFGIAAVADGTALTGTGMVLGTLPYVSPEGWDGAPPDARADIWALGVMLYEMLAGRRPFLGAHAGLLHAAIVTSEPPRLETLRPDAPAALVDAIASMLAKDPARRMASVRELGVIVERLRRGDDATPTTGRVAAGGGATPSRGALPVPPTPLVGRGAECDALCALLVDPQVRLLTLTGAGGSGKTRLAIEAARRVRDRFPHGVTFVDLTPIADADRVLPTLAHALEVEEDLYRPLTELVAERLRDERRLLLLDNFEQVVGAAPMLAALLAAAPGVTACVTSRFLLHVTAERDFAVQPLHVPDPETADAGALMESDAVALFVERARALDPRFAPDAAATRIIARICRRLDGLPLAIELAAARARVLPPARLLVELDRPLALLTTGPSDRAPHQRTLRRAIAWSHDLLDERDRALFRSLALFVGGWSLDDVEPVVGGVDDTWDLATIVDGLQSLIDKSLVTVRDVGGEPRYGMLETLREFARDALAQSPEHDAVARRHAEHFAALAARWSEQVPTARQGEALARFAAARENMLAALAWADRHDPALLGATVAAMGRFWYLAGHWHEALGWYARALAHASSAAPAAHVAVLDHMARLEMFLGDETSALAHHEEAVALVDATGDAVLAARTREGLGEVLLKVGDTARANALLDDAQRIARAADHRGVLAAVLTTQATARVAADDVAHAERLLEEALRLAHVEGDRFVLAKIHYYLGGLALLRGEHDAAASLCEAGRDVAADSGDASWACHLDEMLGRALLADGGAPRARSLIAHSLGAFHAVGSRSCLPHSLEAVARMRLAAVADDDRSAVAAATDAAHLIGTAEAVCDALAIAMLPVERALFVQTRERARAALGEDVFARERAAGRRRTEERAIADALAMLRATPGAA